MARKQQQDGFGRITKVTESKDATTSFDTTYNYDPVGNLLTVTDAKGNTTGITYDSLSRKIQMSDPSMGLWYYYYDASGNLTQQTDSKGQTIDFQYDPLSRLSSKQYPNGDSISYTYDDTLPYTSYGARSKNYGIGRLAMVVDNKPSDPTGASSSGMTQFFYDKQGRTTQVLRTTDGARNSTVYGTQFQYDPLGHVTNIAYPDSDQVNYQYDPSGNMSSVLNSDSSSKYATFSGYNALGQPTNIGFQNGVNTILSYDTATNRLQEMTTTLPSQACQPNVPNVLCTYRDYKYSYDNNGNILSIQDKTDSTGNQDQTFTYDWLNRLTSAHSPSYVNAPNNTINYNLDAAGNVNNPGAANSAEQNSQALTYDYDNRVTSITTGGATTSFVYDSTGARVKKTSNATGVNSVTTYVSKLYDVQDGVVRKHIFAGGRRIATKTGSDTYFYHLDHLGSLSLATNAGGSLVQAVTYYPFGDIRTNSGPTPGSQPVVDLPYKFTGHELDNETGLYYCGARYYDAAQGRFITPDTIVQSPGNPQTLNRYAYAGNNPLAFVDPTGHGFLSFFEDFFAALFGTIVTVLSMGADIPWLIAGVFGGMAGAAADAAMHGGSLGAVVQAAGMGGFSAGMGMTFGLAGSVGIAAATGGFKRFNFESFAAGILGSLAGSYVGDYLNNAINSSLSQASDYQSNMRDMDKGDPVGKSSSDSSTVHEDMDKGSVIESCLNAPPMSSDEPNPYNPRDLYAGQSAQGMFWNGGDNKWAILVRGCLACNYAGGADMDAAHWFCYQGEGAIVGTPAYGYGLIRAIGGAIWTAPGFGPGCPCWYPGLY